MVIGSWPIFQSSSLFPLWASVVVDGLCSKVAVFDAGATKGGGVDGCVRASDDGDDHGYDGDGDDYDHDHDDHGYGDRDDDYDQVDDLDGQNDSDSTYCKNLVYLTQLWPPLWR